MTTDQFVQLYQAVHSKARNTVQKDHGATWHDAEDAVQQATAELWAQVDRGTRLKVTPSLFIRRCKDRYLDGRRCDSRPVDEGDGPWVVPAQPMWSGADDDARAPTEPFDRTDAKPDNDVARHEATHALDVQLAVERLPDELTRQAVRLVWLDGETYAQAAKTMRVGKCWIVVALGWARPVLAMMLAQYDPRRRPRSVPAWNRQGISRRPSYQQGTGERDYLWQERADRWGARWRPSVLPVDYGTTPDDLCGISPRAATFLPGLPPPSGKSVVPRPSRRLARMVGSSDAFPLTKSDQHAHHAHQKEPSSTCPLPLPKPLAVPRTSPSPPCAA
jgi:DNA-directed RNA polymerase specialized sigma24 family protein